MRGIYSIRCSINGYIYIGSTTTSFQQRWGEHKRKLQNNKHPNRHLQSAWNKYGKDAFVFTVVEVIDDKPTIIAAEQFYLDVFKGDSCYNIIETAHDMTKYAGNMKDRKWSDRKRKASENMNAKQYDGFITPSGVPYGSVVNLSKFMKEHGLNRKTVYRLINGEVFEYKGWKYVSK